VGNTGSGKSSLADVILGVRRPTEGLVRLGGVTPIEAIARWPGRIAYVPQSVALMNSDLRVNVALGMPGPEIDDERVWNALEMAHIAEFFRGGPGLDAKIGERGVRLSGGQRQRIGLARALYTSPDLIVLDEATSALDAETELAIVDALNRLGPGVTRVTIAHRLATIRSADNVIHLERGRVTACGAFESVREESPQFDRQLTALGL
jgi:ABC-type multidrug transport system fused ATPase/permease subunit